MRDSEDAGGLLRFTRTREGLVAFLEAGPSTGSAEERPPLVLVHGFTGHREDFAEVLPSLARHRRVFVPDIRGHGDSSSDSGNLGWTFEQLVNDLLAFLDDREVDCCDLLGHSLGGFVALRFVLDHPARVRSLIFVSTAPETPAGLARAPFDRAAEIAEARGVHALQTLVEKVGRAAATPAVARRGEDYWAHHRRRYGAITPASYRGLGETFFDSVSFVDRLGEIEQPCLVMVGEEDEPWLPGAALFEQNLPQATRVTIPGAEHHPHQENPEAFLEAIERHLATVEATSASSRSS
jgi:pimeloyl-ACP methyl ester carboxylesterase